MTPLSVADILMACVWYTVGWCAGSVLFSVSHTQNFTTAIEGFIYMFEDLPRMLAAWGTGLVLGSLFVRFYL